MQYIVFSLGHFFSSDVSTLKSNLTTHYATHGRPDITGDHVWDFLAKSKDAENKIPLYALRMGMNLFEFWQTKIQTQFPLAFDSPEKETELFNDFQAAWLSMCQFTPHTKSRVEEFIDYLNEYPETAFILVSHTNHAQFEYIQRQITEQFGEHFPHSQFHFVTSMDSKKEAHPDTLAYAFENNVIVLNEEDEIISCLKTITESILPQYIQSSHELPETFDMDDFKDKMPSSYRSCKR